MINHVTVKVKDFEKEEAFYEAALTPLGYGKGPAFPGVQAFVAEDGSAVWVSTAAEGDAVAPIHVAFQAADNDAVKAFYEAGLADGGTDNGEPGTRTTARPIMPLWCIIRRRRHRSHARLSAALAYERRITPPYVMFSWRDLSYPQRIKHLSSRMETRAVLR